MTDYAHKTAQNIIRRDVDELMAFNKMSTDEDSYSLYHSPAIIKVSDDLMTVIADEWIQTENNVIYKNSPLNNLYDDNHNILPSESLLFTYPPIPELEDKQILGVKFITNAYGLFGNKTVKSIYLTNTNNENVSGKYLKLVFDSSDLIGNQLARSDLGDMRFDHDGIGLSYYFDNEEYLESEDKKHTTVYLKLPYITPNETVLIHMVFTGAESEEISISEDTMPDESMIVDCEYNMTEYSNLDFNQYPSFYSIGVGRDKDIHYKYNTTDWDKIQLFNIGGKKDLWDFNEEVLSNIIVNKGIQLELNINGGYNTNKAILNNPLLYIYFVSDVDTEAQSIVNKLQTLGINLESELIDSKDTNLKLEANTTTLQINDTLELTATLTDENNTLIENEEIELYQGNLYKQTLTTNGAGQVTFQLDSRNMKQDQYEYHVLYKGTKEYNFSISEVLEINVFEYVSKILPILKLTLSPDNAGIHDNLMITVTAYKNSTEPISNTKINILENGLIIASPTTNNEGIATFGKELDASCIGETLTYLATHEEDAIYGKVNSNSQTIKPNAKPVKFNVPNGEITTEAENSIEYKGTATDTGGKPLKNKTITIYRNASPYQQVTTDTDGTYSVMIANLSRSNEGKETIYSQYTTTTEDKEYKTTTSDILTVKVNGKTSTISDITVTPVNLKVEETITITTSLGLTGQIIQFYDGDKLIGQAQTNNNGIATYNHIITTAGNHTISARYNGNDIYEGCQSVKRIINVDKAPSKLEYEIEETTIGKGETCLIKAWNTTFTEVQININGETISGNPNAEYTFQTQNTGEYTLTIRDLGSSNYEDKTITKVISVIEKLVPEFSISLDKESYTAGDEVNITVTSKNSNLTMEYRQEDTLINKSDYVRRNGLTDYTFSVTSQKTSIYYEHVETITVPKIKEEVTIDCNLPDNISHGKTLHLKAYLKRLEEILSLDENLIFEINPLLSYTFIQKDGKLYLRQLDDSGNYPNIELIEYNDGLYLKIPREDGINYKYINGKLYLDGSDQK